MTPRIPKFVPITDLRSDAAAVMRAVQEGEEPIIIMQRSRPAAVMVSVTTYERMVYEREVLGILAKGESEIREANGVSIDDLLTELQGMLSKESS